MTAQFYCYHCPNCGTTYLTATAPVGPPLRCLSDGLWLRLSYTRPIETDADRALAAQCPMWNGRPRTTVNTKRPCDECKTWVERDGMIQLGAGGRYCSQACADIGTETHRAAMERTAALLETLYQEQPWLRPREKETA
jgi:hypothetical protein